jgi:hypothetical protein
LTISNLVGGHETDGDLAAASPAVRKSPDVPMLPVAAEGALGTTSAFSFSATTSWTLTEAFGGSCEAGSAISPKTSPTCRPST